MLIENHSFDGDTLVNLLHSFVHHSFLQRLDECSEITVQLRRHKNNFKKRYYSIQIRGLS